MLTDPATTNLISSIANFQYNRAALVEAQDAKALNCSVRGPLFPPKTKMGEAERAVI
jgi:hypothetical protein